MVELGDIAFYPNERISYNNITTENYTSVENLLQDKEGRKNAAKVPTDGNGIRYTHGDILIGNIRPYLKKIWKADNDGGTNGDVLVVRCMDKKFVSPSYLYYVLSSDKFFSYSNNSAKGAKMPRGDKAVIMKYEFCLPSLKEQERIVSILDRFDRLCNDLSAGLPAEIEARKKQYEFYRDRLLTFSKKES